MTTNQIYWTVVGGMVVFWICFGVFVWKQPERPRYWWTYENRSENERRKIDEARTRVNNQTER